jgi:hypothetical protein
VAKLSRGRKRTSLWRGSLRSSRRLARINSIDCLRGFGASVREPSLLAYLQGPFGIEKPIQLDELSQQPGPAGLMAGAQPGTVVAVEVFVKEDVIAQWGSLWNFSAPP